MSLASPTFPLPEAESTRPAQADAVGTPAMPQGEQPSSTADLLTRVVKGAHETIDHFAERAKPPLEKLEQGLAQTGESLQGQAEQWRTTGDEWAEGVRVTVREHPLAAVAAALAVGLLVARLAR